MQIVVDGGYPELRIHGKPFFVHSAAFHYYRIPRDQWPYLLDRYRDMGINTIDIYIPWNWHEPADGQFDFDGHSNPRRDLRALLQMIAARGFKLIARPGPEILNEWKNAGYPDWLLSRPEYHMDSVDILEGRYPPEAELNTQDADAAAKDWLDNPVHMKYAALWMEAVARELAPYSNGRTVAMANDSRRVAGPLLFVQLEDDMAIGRTNFEGAHFWRYMEALRSMLQKGGLDVPVYINPTDMRVSASGEGLSDPIGTMGQWYMPPRKEDGAGQRLLDDDDASEIEFYTEELKTQPLFPPIMIEFQAGWYCPGDNDRPVDSPEQNTLLASRLMVANGAHGFNYFPLQDTYTPAGYSVPWANRFYRWDAPLDVNGEEQARATAVMRNGEILKEWGSWLAASHKRADFGIAYPLGSFPQNELKPQDVDEVSNSALQLEMLGQLTHHSSELLDPEYQPVDQLLRDAVIFLPVFNAQSPQFQMSEKSQQALVEYVRRGGTLVVFPAKPAGSTFAPLWENGENSATASSAFGGRWSYGAGRVYLIPREFESGVDLNENFTVNASQTTFADAAKTLDSVLAAAHIRPVVQVTTNPPPPADYIVTELVSNEGTGLLGQRTGGQALLSVTNLSTQPVDQNLEVLSPLASSRSADPPDSDEDSHDYILVHAEIPSRESLLLPVEQPLCESVKERACPDTVIASGAELLDTERKGRSLYLTFYSPTRTAVRLHLEEKPGLITLVQNLAGAHWNRETHELDVSIPRGPAPDFQRELTLGLPYVPRVGNKSESDHETHPDIWVRFLDAIPLPLGPTAYLNSYPPLIPVEAGKTPSLYLEARDFTSQHTIKVAARLEGYFQGEVSLHAKNGASELARMRLTSPGVGVAQDAAQPKAAQLIGSDGLIHESLVLHEKPKNRTIPVDILLEPSSQPIHYLFDFDRDGAPEWVLENPALRIIVSPASGGRILAVVDKSSTNDVVSSVGALRDGFSYTENPPNVNPIRERGRYGLFNRAYAAKWQERSGGTSLVMNYTAPDVQPNGAAIEKQIYFDEPDSFRADYSVSLAPVEQAASVAHTQAFVVQNSVPARTDAENPTRFCWSLPGEAAASDTGAAAQKLSSANARCEDFRALGKVIVLPPSVTRLEVRRPGKPSLILEWANGQMRIEQETFSALLSLEFPALTPGGPPGHYFVSFRVDPGN